MALSTGILLVIIASVIGAFGALMLKLGASTFSMNPLKLIKNFKIMLGLFFYTASTVPFIMALQHGPVSVLYPFASLTYIWVIILSRLVLKEEFNNHKIAGFVLILFGVVLIGIGS